MKPLTKKSKLKDIVLKAFFIVVLLLFLGVVISIAFGNIDKIAILWKTP